MQKLTIASEKIQIACVWEDDLTYIHYWHPNNDSPLPVCSVQLKLEEEALKKYLCTALNMLTVTSYKYGVEWIGDYPWDKLPENFAKLEKIISVEKKKLEEEQREYIKETQNALHYMSSKLPVQNGN